MWVGSLLWCHGHWKEARNYLPGKEGEVGEGGRQMCECSHTEALMTVQY